ncbi:ABC transporter substrate-binding protein [Ferribacterium limneticum]|uniref:ABC transporter substrate-binding protein n=1 Tax=Ferribacterium limneticum TaxID=76259 RepID=UPI001CFB7E3E|nr:ABC transporter substrate-binding protein [Ferribacterium limneticum]UCV27233.1 ABC transporter substrate-binding protein [Ferribacterium limneticum]UCV31150.1 ABC transporter substrate-binding protein [Ferribacterium limneticum]
MRKICVGLTVVIALSGCGQAWNDPYPMADAGRNILYTAFTDRPKHLDPAQSYTEDEITFTAQIYEPPLQYHYLKRPYELIPATVEQVPVPRFFDSAGRALPHDAPAERIAESVYELKLKPGIRFQPHPAFAVDANGQPVYLGKNQADGRQTVADFPQTGTRELTADDYIYQIKRLAHPRLHSPIFGMMADKIVGLKEFGENLQKAAKDKSADEWLDLDAFPLAGVEKLDSHTWRIRIKGKYPQFLYWLAMPFFAPVPREADRFFAQPGMAVKNLTLDWWPVGTGPYTLSENDPNRRMVLSRNPNFHGQTYPCEGEAGDRAAGLLEDCGRPLPFIDQAIFTREKEAIPYWNKFLQGYYDASGISSDSFDQAVRVNVGGDVALTDEMRDKGIRLLTSVKSSTFYMGFNMLDPVIGGLSPKATKLRQAISIAIDQEEYISIFQNGRGIAAQSPLPPGIFGYEAGEPGIDSTVYDWVDGQPKRKPVEVARKLVADAGYPNGRDEKTGEPLVVNLDTTGGGMGEKSRLDWLTRQFAKIDIQLVVRSTDFNRFQDKIRKGNVQLYYLGWNADYPDPENFFFLLDGNEGKVAKGGENASNYANPEFDRLFARMKNMDNTPERLGIVRQMNRILHHDAPWVFGLHPKSYTLGHRWLKNRKPNDVGNNILKYQRIDVADRAAARHDWNRPVLWPLGLGLLVLVSAFVPAMIGYRRRERRAAVK